MFVTNLSGSKIQCCKLRQHVAQSRLKSCFLQQILVLLLMLPLKLQLILQQIWIQCLWLAIAKSDKLEKKLGGRWRWAWIQSRPGTFRKSSVCPGQQPQGLSESCWYACLFLQNKQQKSSQNYSFQYWKNFAGQKTKWNFVGTLNYVKENAFFTSTLLTNYTCRIMQTVFLLWDKLVTNMVIHATMGFNLQCNNVARQVQEKSCPYYRT